MIYSPATLKVIKIIAPWSQGLACDYSSYSSPSQFCHHHAGKGQSGLSSEISVERLIHGEKVRSFFFHLNVVGI